MKAIKNLLIVYILCIILMLAYLVFLEDIPFDTAIKPALLWPETLYYMIKGA
jgi:hypothetical protein